MYLLDTDVISILRRPGRLPSVDSWAQAVADTDLHLSAVSIGELSRGVEKERGRNPGFASDLDTWLIGLVSTGGKRILPFGTREALEWGRVCARIGNSTDDLKIAATAIVHGLTVVTRNVRHFAPTGVRVFDPAAE